MNDQMLPYQVNCTQLIAWLDLMKCSRSATAWVLKGLEEAFLAEFATGLHKLHYKQRKELRTGLQYKE